MKNSNFWLYVSAILLCLIVGVFGVSPARAQSDVTNIRTTKISGDVLQVENNKLTVQTGEGTKQFTVSDNVTIDKNTLNASLQDIQPGDRVTVTMSDKGEVLGVNAVAGQVFDWSKYAVPIALGILLLALIFYSLWKKGQQGHIKTTVAHMNS